MEKVIPNKPYSVSRIKIEIIIEKKGIVKAELIRHLAPLSISEILKKLPITGNIHYNHDNFCYMNTNLNLGAEKQKKIFKIKDISYLTSSGTICFFIKDTITTSMNYLGKIISDIDLLAKVKSTDIITLRKEI
jgi:hypothetical protein